MIKLGLSGSMYSGTDQVAKAVAATKRFQRTGCSESGNKQRTTPPTTPRLRPRTRSVGAAPRCGQERGLKSPHRAFKRQQPPLGRMVWRGLGLGGISEVSTPGGIGRG